MHSFSYRPARSRRTAALLAASLALASSMLHAQKSDLILYNGDVVTLDPAGAVAEAVWVRDGKIEAVGTREEILRHKTESTTLVDLLGGALLPGFVEPHLHLDAVTLLSFHQDASPCLPAPYETRKTCPRTLLESLHRLGRHASEGSERDWLVANGLDPSREPDVDLARSFHDNPAFYIDKYVSKTRPVLILDASGHLAYTNLMAFQAAKICPSAGNCTARTALKPEPAQPGHWATKDGVFTGLLVEAPAFTDFEAAIPKPSRKDFIERAEWWSREFSKTGVTTMVNGGTFSPPVTDLLQVLAQQSRDHPVLRYRTLLPVEPNGPNDFGKPSPWDESNGALFGVTGLKIVSDGSDQGCNGALLDPYAKSGLCGKSGVGRTDYDTRRIRNMLASPWKAGWPVQIHTNGDRAIRNALDAFAALQTQSSNPSPMVLLHFTIDGNPATGEDMVQRVADLRAGRYVHDGKTAPPVDVHVSHIIGHVAYWGGAFQSILDGVSGPGHPDEQGRAARIDATKRELELGVPFSLHSDMPVTPVHPLWYVEQAVTRYTWFYPKLAEKDRHLMPGRQNITVEQALRAVTIDAARQNGLAPYIGSIEKGKAADLVILDKNPLRQPPDRIHQIRVLSTFVGGFRNDWLKP